MINENMLKTFLEGCTANLLLILTNIGLETFNTVFNIICHGLVTLGTLVILYKQYKKHNK